MSKFTTAAMMVWLTSRWADGSLKNEPMIDAIQFRLLAADALYAAAKEFLVWFVPSDDGDREQCDPAWEARKIIKAIADYEASNG